MRRINCTIPLLEGQIEIFSGHGETWAKAEHALVSMQLTPTPRVFIEISDVPISLSGNLYNYGKLSKIRRPHGPEIEVRTIQVQLAEDSSSLLIPTQEPVTSKKTGASLETVRFDIVNFPSLHQSDRPAVLLAGSWRIEINPHRELAKVKKALKVESGYALTHEGTLRRADGKSFPVEAAEKVIETLHLFLSFARGGSCGITLIEGNDESGNKVWEQWGSYSTFPWFALRSWLDHRHNNDEELAKAFPGFFRVMSPTGEGLHDRVLVALYWYLRSNESNSPYSGIVLTQAALERLAREALAHEGLSDEEWRRLRTAERIGKALAKAGIDFTLPEACRELGTLNYADGPRALVEIRNDLVHAAAGRNMRLEAYMQAQDLGQWYAELLLLWKFGYRGRYANRLAYAYDGKWRPEVVPWAG